MLTPRANPSILYRTLSPLYPTMIRVKRRIDESPLEAFVLNSKRRREEELLPADKNEVSTILKFAGTVQNQVQSINDIPKMTPLTQSLFPLPDGLHQPRQTDQGRSPHHCQSSAQGTH